MLRIPPVPSGSTQLCHSHRLMLVLPTRPVHYHDLSILFILLNSPCEHGPCLNSVHQNVNCTCRLHLEESQPQHCMSCLSSGRMQEPPAEKGAALGLSPKVKRDALGAVHCGVSGFIGHRIKPWSLWVFYLLLLFLAVMARLLVFHRKPLFMEPLPADGQWACVQQTLIVCRLQ